MSFSASAADAPKKPSGTVSINETQFALIVGGSTGGGVLTYQGKKYPFKISGMSLVMAAMWLLVRNDGPRKKSSDVKRPDDFDGADALN